ncbi:hypothetical protein [Ornithinimicrobium kibberense]|uniref:hypothetical protein n=1 Tax=Ornithinimicrobium kibberense TaxID=282060 RepID=UPI003615EEB9
MPRCSAAWRPGRPGSPTGSSSPPPAPRPRSCSCRSPPVAWDCRLGRCWRPTPTTPGSTPACGCSTWRCTPARTRPGASRSRCPPPAGPRWPWSTATTTTPTTSGGARCRSTAVRPTSGPGPTSTRVPIPCATAARWSWACPTCATSSWASAGRTPTCR